MNSPINTPPRSKNADAAATTTKGSPVERPGRQAEQEQQQAHDARTPQRPTKKAPKAKPAETGKPVWDKPHSA